MNLVNSPFDANIPLLVIYHGGDCRDGFCAAFLADRVFPNAEYLAAQYGDPAPDVTGKQVLIVDFCYPLADMVTMQNSCMGNMVVIDHHKTAEPILKEFVAQCDLGRFGSPHVIFDINHSGAMLAYEFLNPISGNKLTNLRWLVQYVEDRDLWAWKLNESRPVNAAIRLYELKFFDWSFLALVPFPELVKTGTTILRRESQIIESHVRHAQRIVFDGYTVPCVNCTVDIVSEVCGELAKGHPFAMTYFDTAEGFRVFSLRSDKDSDTSVDVSEIARHHGGGGHKHAASFRIRTAKYPVTDRSSRPLRNFSKLSDMVSRLREGLCQPDEFPGALEVNQTCGQAADMLEEIHKLLEEITDMAICGAEGNAHALRRIVGYVEGPYPDLKPAP